MSDPLSEEKVTVTKGFLIQIRDKLDELMYSLNQVDNLDQLVEADTNELVVRLEEFVTGGFIGPKRMRSLQTHHIWK